MTNKWTSSVWADQFSDLLMINKNHLLKLFSLLPEINRRENIWLRRRSNTRHHLSFRASVVFEPFTESYLYFAEFITIKFKRWRFILFPSDLSIWSAGCDPQRALQAAAGSRPHSAGGLYHDQNEHYSWFLSAGVKSSYQLNLSPKSNTHIRRKDRKKERSSCRTRTRRSKWCRMSQRQSL